MLNFENYKKNLADEQAEAERAYEEELRRKPANELTPEEIGYLYDLNENFCGKAADKSKLMRYGEIKSQLAAFLGKCDEATKVAEFEPGERERHALIGVDMKPVTTLEREEAVMLSEVMEKSDRVIISTDGDRIRFFFSVENIWKSHTKGAM